MIVALFVEANGPYAQLPGAAIPWCGGPDRDAALYAGDLPVVAHPPCARWGRMAEQVSRRPGQPAAGDDGGMFASALANVRRCGGVLEHPEGSRAWATFGLHAPRPDGLWWQAHDGPPDEWTAYLDQSAYGHVCQKPTWLFYKGLRPPAPVLTGGAPSRYVESLSSGDRRRHLTPLPLALLLLSIAAGSAIPASGPALTPYRHRRSQPCKD